MLVLLPFLVGLLARVRAQGYQDFWDRAPIRYSDTVASNKLTELCSALSSGKAGVPVTGGLDRLRFVLKTLNVPAESQVLVFSKTSLQNDLIQPANPRALYFSEIIDPGSDPKKGPAGHGAKSWAEKITGCIFFRDEADLGEGVEGDTLFQNAFLARYPKTEDASGLESGGCRARVIL